MSLSSEAKSSIIKEYARAEADTGFVFRVQPAEPRQPAGGIGAFVPFAYNFIPRHASMSM